MSTPRTNRLSRTAAKEVPHRGDHRYFAAKAEVRTLTEDLEHDLRHSAAHAPVVADFRHALAQVADLLHDLDPHADGARNQVRDLAKEVQHLALAHTWVSHGERVRVRLSVHGPHAVREALDQAQDSVVWCVRAGHWDGQLTAAVTVLERAVKDAEVHAARVIAASA